MVPHMRKIQRWKAGQGMTLACAKAKNKRSSRHYACACQLSNKLLDLLCASILKRDTHNGEMDVANAVQTASSW